MLYFISHYAAEPIFIAACSLPEVYFLVVMLFLRFGGCGRMLTAKNRAKRLARKGVITGGGKALFYQKCVKKTPASVRAAYALFAEGKMPAEELTIVAVRSVKTRGDLIKGGMTGVGISSALAVFLTFYFGAPIGETLLRAVICGFFAAVTGVALHFFVCAVVLAAEKAAERFVAIADGCVLRERKDLESCCFPPQKVATQTAGRDRATLTDLRALLRDLDRAGEPRTPLSFRKGSQ